MIILASDITRNTASVLFEVPRIIVQETYRIEYGLDPRSLDYVSQTTMSTTNTSEVDVPYIIQLNGLLPATAYYFRVSATYDTVFTRYSEISAFRTLENGIQKPIIKCLTDSW